MKRILGLLMVGVLMVGCGEKEEVKIPEVPETEVVQNEEVEEVQEEVEPVEEEPVKNEVVGHKVEIGIADEISGVNVEAYEIVKGTYTKYALNMEIENTNDFDVQVWSDVLVVNGAVDFVRHMIPVKAGEKLTYAMDLKNPEITEGEFEYIQEITLQLVVTGDSLPNMGVKGNRMVLETEYAGGDLPRPNEFGNLLFSEGGVSIYGTRVEDKKIPFDGVRLLVLNDVGQDIRVRVHDCIVNGEYIGTQEDMGLIPANSYALVYDTMDRSMMEKYGMTEIETVEIGFAFYNVEDGEMYYSIDPMAIWN